VGPTYIIDNSISEIIIFLVASEKLFHNLIIELEDINNGGLVAETNTGVSIQMLLQNPGSMIFYC
jgi:hypothetical protein